MTTQVHITNLIPDYLLGLLPPHENLQVETHMHNCADCRAALAAERQIGETVRQTLAIVTRPTPGQLTRLRPVPPKKSRFRSLALFQNSQRLAAGILFIIMILAGNWIIQSPGGPENNTHQLVTAIAVTATREPTSTIIPETPEDATDRKQNAGPSPTYEVQLPVKMPETKTSWNKTTTLKISPVTTPRPAGTPIAAMPVGHQP